MATQGFSLMASAKRSKAFCRSPAREKTHDQNLIPFLPLYCRNWSYMQRLHPPSPRASMASIFFSLAWSIISSVTWGNASNKSCLKSVQLDLCGTEAVRFPLINRYRSWTFYLYVFKVFHVQWHVGVGLDHSLFVHFWKSKRIKCYHSLQSDKDVQVYCSCFFKSVTRELARSSSTSKISWSIVLVNW